MMSLALNHQKSLLRLSAKALAIILMAGSVFLVMRFYHLSGRNEPFPFIFETSRMLINFGGMALLSPIVYLASAQGIRKPRWKVFYWVLGQVAFALAYLLFNKAMFLLIGNGGLSFDFVKGGKKLFLNFGHILVIFYATLAYGSRILLLKRLEEKEANSSEKPAVLPVKINGIETNIACSEIIHIKADDHYLRLYHRHGFHLMRRSISGIVQELPTDFLQIHRSTIINASYLSEIKKEGGRLWVRLADGSIHRVSASFEASVLKLKTPH